MNAPLACYHCGLPVPAGSRFQAVVLKELRSFCCPGCQAVAEAIAASGLDHYYQQRSEPSTNPAALPQQLADELKLFDRPDVQAEWATQEGELNEACLLLEGISCAACGWLIEQHLKALPGIAEARLNLSNHRLNLRWIDQQIPLSEVLASLRKIGYAAHPYQPDQAAQQLHQANRKALRQIGVAGLLWMQVMMASMATWPEFNLDLSADMDLILRWVSLFLTTPIVFYCCGDFFKGALRDLKSRHLTMDVSVSLAIGGAYGAGIWATLQGSGELYFDAAGMFALFLLTGRYLERRARERTAQACAQLVNLLPASCLRLDEQGQTSRVLVRELNLADQLLIPPGQVLPADCVIIQGQSSIDESLLTGEYLPLPRTVGDSLTAGTLNVESPLIVRVQALGKDTRLSAIVRLLERAQSDKPRLSELADRAAQWFLLIAFTSALIVGLLWWQIDGQRALWIVLALLVATCPCALSLATPTALTTATGTLHQLGLLLTRGHVLEGLNHIDTLIVDKTGTLTEGKLTLRQVLPLSPYSAEQCLSWAASLEQGSEHPIAKAFAQAQPAQHIERAPGRGLQGVIDGQVLRIGEPGYVCALSDTRPPEATYDSGQWLLLGDKQGPLAWLVLDDRLRSDAAQLMTLAKQRNWQVLLLSGDHSPMVQQIAQQLGIQDARGGLTPDDKLAVLHELHRQGRKVLMLGDGVNDVPVLAGADISIAMGSASDLAKTSADAVLLSNRLESLVQACALAARTRRIIIENLSWAALYNGLILPFAALGWVTPGWAALGMSISSLVVVLNALRLARPLKA